MKILFYTLSLVLTCCLLSSKTFGQSIDVVDKQILAIGIGLVEYDYELTHEIKYGSLRNGQSENYYFYLNRGDDYAIFAVCDGDCGDMDLRVYDENGNLVASDTSTDDRPMVTVSPRWSGSFKLRTTMYNCRYNPCRFGIGVFGK